MKRIIIAIIFIVFLIALSIISNLFLKFSTKSTVENFENAYLSAQNNDLKNAEKQLDIAVSEFQKNQHFYVMIIRTTPLETITENMASLKTYLEFNEISLFCAESKKVISLIEHLWETEQPTINNII